MYQAAGEKWMKAGASSHAVCLYAHDKEVQEQFFRYGFGLRSIDAVRTIEEIKYTALTGVLFRELPTERKADTLALNNLLILHCEKSPAFMRHEQMSKNDLQHIIDKENNRYFAAYKGNDMIAYIKTADYGENFACDYTHMINICGAFCLSEYRGIGVYQRLLNYMRDTLKNEGYTRLGVDFESFNPTAYGFWLKYFAAYTYGVVRRIDEHIIIKPR
jgi:GNAT superfamily N-acetyltransferase